MKSRVRIDVKSGKYAAVTALAICICVTSLTYFSLVARAQVAHSLFPGQIVDVACAADATQTYALYLPSGYTPAKQWPIIYLFDPGGHGRRPVDLYKELAEKYGFILAGSNNSRNFGADESKAVNSIWQDTHERLVLDEHRSYTSGFSGGARVAGSVALSLPPGQIAGVIAHGAGYPSNRTGSKDNLPYFFAVGDEDFNWPEVINIRQEREEQGLKYQVRVFHGRHQWAPAVVMEDAVEYMNLKAMQAGSLAPEPGFIDQAFAKIKSEAGQAEATKNPVAQLDAYRALVSDFAGLHDVKDASDKLAAIKQSSNLKLALKNEAEEMLEQRNLEQEIDPKIDFLAENSTADKLSIAIEIRQQIGALSDQAKHAKSERKRRICSRAFTGIFVQTMESGQRELEARHFENAEAYFDLMRQVTEEPWPSLLLADTHAASGNRKLAIKDLQEAVRRGLKDRTVIESDERLRVLRGEPEFEKLISGLEGKRAAP